MRYQRVETEPGLLQALEAPGTRILCGGTDLLVKLRAGLLQAECLVDIASLASLHGIRETEDALVVGAATPETDLLESAVVCSRFPVLTQAIAQLGSTQIRNRGTLGGNLVNASPAADSAVPLLVYDAELELVSAAQERVVALSDFLTGPSQTLLEPGEFLRRIRIPYASGLNWTHYHKVGKRNALTIAIASVGMAGTLEDGVYKEMRIAAGSVAPTAKRLPAVEALIVGVPLADLPIEKIHAVAMDSIAPISDVRATAEYRRRVVADLIVRALGDVPA